MAEYLVNNTDLTSIANAIRTKGGINNRGGPKNGIYNFKLADKSY